VHDERAAGVTGPLAGQLALVTGGSKGIGRSAARLLRAAGAEVVLVARTRGALEEAAGVVGGHAVVADVSDADAVERLRARVEAEFGAPHVIVNAAGAFALARIAETPAEVFDRQIAANLRAPFLVMRAFLPAMLVRRSGTIVSIGSIAGRRAFPSNGAYSASKFGLRGLHAVLDEELRGSGVRAVLIEPAATDTPLWDAIDRNANPGLPTPEMMLDADAVADAIVYAVTRPPTVALHNVILERS